MYRVGIIGAGRPWRSTGATGFGMAHMHAEGYRASSDACLVAVADLSLDNARAFQQRHSVGAVYQDYRAMLAQERLDIVSICTWPHLHAEMVIACAESGVRAVHCEKPMAPTFGEAKRMIVACEASGTQLTFNHQRRFGEPFRAARHLLRAGAIGMLRRMEATCTDLFDWGTHWFDMLFFFNDETPVEWVIGQIDTRDSRTIFGVTVEGQGVSQFRFHNGVTGMVLTGASAPDPLIIRLYGERGMIEIGGSDQAPLRLWNERAPGWQTIDVSEGLHDAACHTRAILDLIDALSTGREPELSARRALRATEVIFASYESSRRRGRVDLPLTIDDSPLAAMMALDGSATERT
ncbi:MAG: gfo/Idh/MocA family oxidoreductase [Roseiflexus castenholzii]|uniref:Gfo/Idh/MocA family protein n=1 Tax=Roseiflexus castenholzii TaxID=120962 RepID=UPI000CB988D1|nr:MAG: gfo/Idh/MocA family oxidoreductase [Roseiflexus castenholzii]